MCKDQEQTNPVNVVKEKLEKAYQEANQGIVGRANRIEYDIINELNNEIEHLLNRIEKIRKHKRMLESNPGFAKLYSEMQHDF